MGIRIPCFLLIKNGIFSIISSDENRGIDVIINRTPGPFRLG